MIFANIYAQDMAVRALKSCIKKNQVAHAYLFTGPSGTGKSSTALAFASALNCTNPTPEGDACGSCLSCSRIASGEDADVRVVRPEGNQTTIEQMRDMIKELGYAPFSGKYKVFIIEQADTLNSSSENSILKVLEEPPAYAVLILLSCNQSSLLPTIRSRCRTVRFRQASDEELEEALRSRFNLPEDDLRIVAACSEGAVGYAFDMASDSGFMEDRQVIFQAVKDWYEGPPVLGLQTAELLRSIASERKSAKGSPEVRTLAGNLLEILDSILSWYEDILRLKVSGESARVTNLDYLDDLIPMSGRYSTAKLCASVRAIMETRRYVQGNITPQLALENMFIAIRPDL